MEKKEETVKTPVSVILPAYNEEKGVGSQVAAIREVLTQGGFSHEIIVVDDGSEDRTVEEALRAQARVLRHPRNRGYGASLKTGIVAAKNETIVIIDADGTYPPEAIPDMLERSEQYDMVVGSRTGDNVQIPFSRKPAKWFLRVLASYLAECPIPDLNSGLRVMKRSVVKQFYPILPSGFSFTTTITLALLCNDYLVDYFPIPYHSRIGKSKIRPVDAYHFFLLILRTMVYFNPLKVFLPFGAIFFLAGSAKFIYDLFRQNLSEGAIFGFIAAFVIWAIGLLSDQIAKVGLRGKLE